MASEESGNHIWIRAEGGPSRSVIYYDKNGNKMTRYLDPTAKNPPRGSKSWLHQNPGNIVRGSFANDCGAIGFAGYPSPDNPSKISYFAVFPDYETGRNGLAALLKTEKYIGLTLNEFPRRYTGVATGKPDSEEVKVYRNNLRKISGFDMNRTIGSFEGEEYEKLLDTIQQCEGWYPGDEEIIEIAKIIGVNFFKGRIVEYCVQFANGLEEWLARDQAIRLAEEKVLLAVVVHGHCDAYLRCFPHHQKFRDMFQKKLEGK